MRKRTIKRFAGPLGLAISAVFGFLGVAWWINYAHAEPSRREAALTPALLNTAFAIAFFLYWRYANRTVK
jgi:hypothetical protein